MKKIFLAWFLFVLMFFIVVGPTVFFTGIAIFIILGFICFVIDIR